MNTQRHPRPVISQTRQRNGHRLIVAFISLACVCMCLLYPVLHSKRATAQPQPVQVQTTEVDRLIEECHQLFARANYQQVLETCTKAVEKAREIGDRQDEVYSLLNLGSAYGALGQYPKAIDYSEQSLQLAQELGDRQGEAYALLNLGSAYKSLRQYAEAIDYSERSLHLSQELGNRRGEAYALINLGSANWSLRRYLKAIDYSEQSLHLTQAIGDRRGEVCSLINLGSAYGSLGEDPKAVDYFSQSLRIAQDTNDRRGEAIALNNLGYVLYKDNHLIEAEPYLRQAINVFESLRPALSDADKLALFETLTNPYYNLQGVLVAQGKAIEALEIAERGRTRAFVELLARRLTSVRARSLAEAQVATPITLTEIKRVARDQHATLVEYSVAASDQLYIWVVSPAGDITFRAVDLSQRQPPLDALVSTTNANIVKPPPQTDTTFSLTTNRSNLTNDSYSHTGLQQLYQVLIAPIKDLLPTNPDSHVIFVPHSMLFLTPFPALQAADGTYLIEHHTIRSTPSIQVLQLVHRQQQQRRQAIEQVLVVGNPTGDLPAAEQEAKAIARFFNAKLFLGKQATEAAVTQQMPEAHLIHIAAHAAPNRLDGSYGGLIVLADPTQGFSNLTTNEILEMQLRAELVVLSGCNTGISDIINSDGVVGLARSIMAAGVPSILMSLWQVPDVPTATLMQEFYQYWQPNSQSHRRERIRFLALPGVGTFILLGIVLQQIWLRSSASHFHRHGWRKRWRGLWNLRWLLMTAIMSAALVTVNAGTMSSPPPRLDKAQALRQAMLSVMETHPEPQNWAAFTLMGEAR